MLHELARRCQKSIRDEEMRKNFADSLELLKLQESEIFKLKKFVEREKKANLKAENPENGNVEKEEAKEEEIKTLSSNSASSDLDESSSEENIHISKKNEEDKPKKLPRSSH
jgi:hypothetical protein